MSKDDNKTAWIDDIVSEVLELSEQERINEMRGLLENKVAQSVREVEELIYFMSEGELSVFQSIYPQAMTELLKQTIISFRRHKLDTEDIKGYTESLLTITELEMKRA